MNINKEIARLIYEHDNQINSTYQKKLEKLKETINLSPEEFKYIESTVRKKYDRGELDHQEYEKVFLEKYPQKLSRGNSRELEELQNFLKLSDQDIDLIESKCIDRERARQHKRDKQIKIRIAILVMLLGSTLIFAISMWLTRMNTESYRYDLCQDVENDRINNLRDQGNQRSLGEQFFIQEEGKTRDPKERAAKHFGNCEFKEAQEALKTSLGIQKNDPEALIYLNNAEAANHPSVKIAVSVPIETNPKIAKEILRGVAQAQKEVNENNGIRGRQLVVEIASDDSNVSIVKDLASEFVEDPDILAVIGHYTNEAALAAAEIYEEKKLVAISPTSASPKLSNHKHYVLRTVPSDSQEAEKLREFIYDHYKDKEIKNLAICASDSSQEFKAEFEAAVQKKNKDLHRNLKSHNCNLDAVSDTDETPKTQEEQLKIARKLVEKIKQNGAEALLLVPSESQHDAALAIAKANQGRLPLFAASTLYQQNTLGAHVEGMTLATPWHPDSNPDNDFAERAKELWKAPVRTWRTASAYDATIAIVEALLRSSQPTREGLREQLFHPGFAVNAVSNQLSFDENGDIEVHPYFDGTIYFVQVVPEGGGNYDFKFLNLRK